MDSEQFEEAVMKFLQDNWSFPATPAQIVELLTGFTEELAYMNRLDTIRKCAFWTDTFVTEVAQLFHYIGNGEVGHAFEEFFVVAVDAIALVNKCDGAPEQVSAMVNWLETTCSSRQNLVDVTSARSHIHTQEIQRSM